ncbi:MAG: class I SAM-dependent methyltransferase, partial [Pseudomonadota bacterium]
DERALSYAEIPAVFGLGILFDTNAPWAGPISDLLVPFHQNRLIAKLEENRLANFLTVLDWQDGHIRRPD